MFFSHSGNCSSELNGFTHLLEEGVAVHPSRPLISGFSVLLKVLGPLKTIRLQHQKIDNDHSCTLTIPKPKFFFSNSGNTVIHSSRLASLQLSLSRFFDLFFNNAALFSN